MVNNTEYSLYCPAVNKLNDASPSPEQMKAAVEKGSNKEPAQQPEWIGHMDDLKRKFGLALFFIRTFLLESTENTCFWQNVRIKEVCV